MDFDLWLESEYLEGPVDDFCNVLVTLGTGEEYALNVWTFGYFEVARRRREESSPDVAARYVLPPDLLVVDLTRATVESVVNDMLERGTMPPDCLVDER